MAEDTLHATSGVSDLKSLRSKCETAPNSGITGRYLLFEAARKIAAAERGAPRQSHQAAPAVGAVTDAQPHQQQPANTAAAVPAASAAPAAVRPTLTGPKAASLVPNNLKPFVPFRARAFTPQQQRQQVVNRMFGSYLLLLVKDLQIESDQQEQVIRDSPALSKAAAAASLAQEAALYKEVTSAQIYNQRARQLQAVISFVPSDAMQQLRAQHKPTQQPAAAAAASGVQPDRSQQQQHGNIQQQDTFCNSKQQQQQQHSLDQFIDELFEDNVAPAAVAAAVPNSSAAAAAGADGKRHKHDDTACKQHKRSRKSHPAMLTSAGGADLIAHAPKHKKLKHTRSAGVTAAAPAPAAPAAATEVQDTDLAAAAAVVVPAADASSKFPQQQHLQRKSSKRKREVAQVKEAHQQQQGGSSSSGSGQVISHKDPRTRDGDRDERSNTKNAKDSQGTKKIKPRHVSKDSSGSKRRKGEWCKQSSIEEATAAAAAADDRAAATEGSAAVAGWAVARAGDIVAAANADCDNHSTVQQLLTPLLQKPPQEEQQQQQQKQQNDLSLCDNDILDLETERQDLLARKAVRHLAAQQAAAATSAAVAAAAAAVAAAGGRSSTGIVEQITAAAVSHCYSPTASPVRNQQQQLLYSPNRMVEQSQEGTAAAAEPAAAAAGKVRSNLHGGSPDSELSSDLESESDDDSNLDSSDSASESEPESQADSESRSFKSSDTSSGVSGNGAAGDETSSSVSVSPSDQQPAGDNPNNIAPSQPTSQVTCHNLHEVPEKGNGLQEQDGTPSHPEGSQAVHHDSWQAPDCADQKETSADAGQQQQQQQQQLQDGVDVDSSRCDQIQQQQKTSQQQQQQENAQQHEQQQEARQHQLPQTDSKQQLQQHQEEVSSLEEQQQEEQQLQLDQADQGVQQLTAIRTQQQQQQKQQQQQEGDPKLAQQQEQQQQEGGPELAQQQQQQQQEGDPKLAQQQQQAGIGENILITAATALEEALDDKPSPFLDFEQVAAAAAGRVQEAAAAIDRRDLPAASSAEAAGSGSQEPKLEPDSLPARVATFVCSVLEPLVRAAVITQALSDVVCDKAVSKIMKRHKHAVEASFLVKEYSAITRLVTDLVDHYQKHGLL